MAKRRKILPGDIIEHLEILENLGYRKYCGQNTTYWKCRCTRCGKIVEVPQKTLGKAQKDCGCWRSLPKIEIKPGTKFGRLKVIEIGEHVPKRGYNYLCECLCDKHTRLFVRGDHLRSGEVTSCGCVHDELALEHVKKAHTLNFVNGTSVNKIMQEKPQRNNTSGAKNVYWHKKTGKWTVSIAYKGEKYYFGYYADKKEAEEVAETARKNVLKDFKEWYSREYPERWKKMREKHNID